LETCTTESTSHNKHATSDEEIHPVYLQLLGLAPTAPREKQVM